MHIKTIFSLLVGAAMLSSLSPSPLWAAQLAPGENTLQPLPRFVYPDISNNVNVTREAYIPETDIEEPSLEPETAVTASAPSQSFPILPTSILTILIVIFIYVRRKKNSEAD